MPTPAVDVHLLPSSNTVATVLSQSADGTICCNATINDCQVKEVQLALGDASTAVEPCSGENPLRVFDVWPEEGEQHVSNRMLDSKVMLAIARAEHTIRFCLIYLKPLPARHMHSGMFRETSA